MSEGYTVGQQVWIYDVNARSGGPERGEVVRVGRKLVTVKYAHLNTVKAFRIEDGVANDNYGHQWIKTDAQRELSDRRTRAVSIIESYHLRPQPGCRLSVEVLEQVAALLEAAQ